MEPGRQTKQGSPWQAVEAQEVAQRAAKQRDRDAKTAALWRRQTGARPRGSYRYVSGRLAHRPGGRSLYYARRRRARGASGAQA